MGWLSFILAASVALIFVVGGVGVAMVGVIDVIQHFVHGAGW